MRKLVVVGALAMSVLSTAVSMAEANSYVDPRAPFNASRFFASIPSGQ